MMNRLFYSLGWRGMVTGIRASSIIGSRINWEDVRSFDYLHLQTIQSYKCKISQRKMFFLPTD
ncbi:hypothetical protein BLX87_07690 [Bacillus sp. VT-16-64]|nr:hypothetical protein BLX87_07690 [Bacillus sp. VT-16-64]